MKARLVLLMLLSFLLSPIVFADTIPPLWESNTGASILNADDGTTPVSFGFNFPFQGQHYGGGMLSSNGYLWLSPSTDSGCCDGNVDGLLAGDPRIAIAWYDLNSDPNTNNGAGNIRYQTFSDHVAITFDQVPECCDTSFPGTFQMLLYNNGTVIFGYNQLTIPSAWGGDILIGLSPGGNAADPGPSDLLGHPTFVSSNGTVYQMVPSAYGGGGGPLFDYVAPDLSGYNLVFTPNADNTWNVTSLDAATPEPASLLFVGAGVLGFLGLRRFSK